MAAQLPHIGGQLRAPLHPLKPTVGVLTVVVFARLLVGPVRQPPVHLVPMLIWLIVIPSRLQRDRVVLLISLIGLVVIARIQRTSPVRVRFLKTRRLAVKQRRKVVHPPLLLSILLETLETADLPLLRVQLGLETGQVAPLLLPVMVVMVRTVVVVHSQERVGGHQRLTLIPFAVVLLRPLPLLVDKTRLAI